MWIQSATLTLLMTSFVAINANDHDERKMMIGVNLMIGVPFVIKLLAGVIW